MISTARLLSHAAINCVDQVREVMAWSTCTHAFFVTVDMQALARILSRILVKSHWHSKVSHAWKLTIDSSVSVVIIISRAADDANNGTAAPIPFLTITSKQI